ncbi:MAG: c-type cytochrome, partial [Planctomycetales bacterium]|nr:c-type cytochrome [Planctomycetales bacterium]
ATRGAEVFRKSCSSCHRLDGIGFEVGPNLAAMKNRGAEAILLNVLDPNREVNPQFLAYTAITVDGQIVNGMIRQENSTSVELVGAEGKSTILLRSELDSLTSTGQSLMPTGLDQQVTPEDMVSLIEFILSPRP